MTLSREQLDSLVQLYQSGQLAAAEKVCRGLLQEDRDSFALNNILGLILQGLGSLQDAVEAHSAAIKIDSQNAKAFSNRGTALMRLGDFKSALADFDQAIALQSTLAGAHLNRGLLLRKLGQLHEALASYETAIQLQPQLAEAWSNNGNVLKDLGRIEEAILNYQKAIQLNPGNTQAHSNLLMAYNYLPWSGRIEPSVAVKAFAETVRNNTASRFTHSPHQSRPDSLRVGFVSGDMRNHPVGYLLEDLLPKLAAGQLKLFAFSSTPEVDALSEHLRPCFRDWLPIYDKSNRQAAQFIHDHKIDVLIDLAGHTANNRLPLFACKPAAVQLSWLGYFATTGLSEIDYVLTDPHLSPEGSDKHFIEQLWRLPDTRWCFSKPQHDCDITPLPALENAYVTFVSCHKLSKINKQVITLWSELLRSLPGSRLLLKNGQCRDPKVKTGLRQQFTALGVENGCITIEGPGPRERYLETYQRVDIALDTFPFTGGVTSIEGLWMGVPFVTLAGETMVERQGASILRNIGKESWIVDSEDQYLEKLIALASDLPALEQERMGLRQNLLASPLLDAQEFARNFEQAIFEIWYQTASARS